MEYKKQLVTIEKADAIVVLSGILEINDKNGFTNIEWGDPDRFFSGLALFNAGKAHKLIFTGGRMPWNKTTKTEGDVLKDFSISFGIKSKNIFVTNDVQNTEEEAKAVNRQQKVDR